jgi:hypothetical protein
MVGVALESIAHAAYGRVAFYGIHHIGITGDVHVGAYLVTSLTSKLAQATRAHAVTSQPPAGAFAVALHTSISSSPNPRHVRAYLLGRPPLPPDPHIRAEDYGVLCDGVTDDVYTLRAALARAAHTAMDRTSGAVVTLPAGSCVISGQLVIQNRVVLRGQGVAATTLHLTSTIPITSPVVVLGAGQALAFGSRLEDIEINANHVANIAVFSQSANENSGLSRVRAIGWLTHGALLLDASSTIFNDNYVLREVEFWKSVNAPVNTGIGIYLASQSKWGGRIDRAMVGQGGATGRQGLAGLYIRDDGTGTSNVAINGLNVESYQSGLWVDTGGGVNLQYAGFYNASGGPGTGITLLNIHSAGTVTANNLVRSGATNLILNSVAAHTVAGSVLRNTGYMAQTSSDGYQVFTSGGGALNTSVPNVFSAASTNYTIATTSTTARPSISLLDGNGDGWQMRHGTPDTGDPFALQHITATFVGSVIFNLEDTGRLTMKSGSSNHFRIGDDFARLTTQGTNAVTLYNGTAPVGAMQDGAGGVSNGATLYVTSGEMRVMDSGGTASLLSPHDKKTGEWIFYSKNTTTGKVLRIDVERMLRELNRLFGFDFIKDYMEQPGTDLQPTEAIP